MHPAPIHGHDDSTERIGAQVIELASRTRELASSSLGLEEHELASSFAQLVEPLERADGRPLYGRGRDDCEALHGSDPVAFQACLDEAADANVRRRCGLLVKLVRSGFGHRAAALNAPPPAPTSRAGCVHPECVDRDVCLRAQEGLA